MNILHLVSARKFVGEAARVVDLAHAQIEAGHNVMLMVREGYRVADEVCRRCLPHVAIRFRSGFHPLADYADVRAIRHQAQALRADVVHAHRSKEHWLAVWALRRLAPRPVLVRSRHVVMPVGNHAANRWLYSSGTDGIIAVSRAVETAIRESLPNCPLRMQCIPGGIHPPHFPKDLPERALSLRRELHIAPEQPVISHLARLARVKGQIHVLEAMARLCGEFPNAVCVFAYSRQNRFYRQELENTVDRLGIRNQIRWVGELDSIWPLLAMSDVTIIASTGSEGWSRVAVESFHAGTPLVATTVGSLPEIVRDGETGLLVPPGDGSALAEAIRGLLSDPHRRGAIGRAARDAARAYNIERVCRDVTAFYQTCLDARKDADA